MQLIPVSLESLSGITYSVALAPHERFSNPEFLIVSFVGKYRDGAEGASDATFIMAIMEAVQRAWFTQCLIVDFSHLTYRWGDEMGWIYGVGRFQPSPCQKPLAIIVGNECRNALHTLSPEVAKECCVESLDDAIALIRSKKSEFNRCMDEWRRNPKGTGTK